MDNTKIIEEIKKLSNVIGYPVFIRMCMGGITT